ncbi:hypothetical protein NDU88_001945 [Pleurodeles waltl]|uniref:Uncharacterized protein n=1 Tax=Pleurodeles waltl TaxID=8319 RepID=A0AAV7L221_PLEWA|nr:hypothetical protein NDU88_001945 [Pleurodeles waltl]
MKSSDTLWTTKIRPAQEEELKAGYARAAHLQPDAHRLRPGECSGCICTCCTSAALVPISLRRGERSVPHHDSGSIITLGYWVWYGGLERTTVFRIRKKHGML